MFVGFGDFYMEAFAATQRWRPKLVLSFSLLGTLAWLFGMKPAAFGRAVMLHLGLDVHGIRVCCVTACCHATRLGHD